MVKTKICGYLILACCVFTGALASADTMVITYRSGKVQTVPMNEPRGEVSGLAYLTDPLPEVPETKPSPLPGAPEVSGRADPVKGGPKEQSAKPKDSGITIKWAPPIGE